MQNDQTRLELFEDVKKIRLDFLKFNNIIKNSGLYDSLKDTVDAFYKELQNIEDKLDSDKTFKKEILAASSQLRACPFCNGKAEFIFNKTNNELKLVHFPALGICCPARTEQVCDNTYMGICWWNKREEPVEVIVPEKIVSQVKEEEKYLQSGPKVLLLQEGTDINKDKS